MAEKVDLDEFEVLIKDEPLTKPLSEYQKMHSVLLEVDRSEGENLKRTKTDLYQLLQTGQYDDSRIARVYKEYVDILLRMLWLHIKIINCSVQTLQEVQQIIKKNYSCNK